MDFRTKPIQSCEKCEGTGKYYYPSTGTYFSEAVPGVIVCHAFTEDVCNDCWGTGDKSNPGENLLIRDLIADNKRTHDELARLKYPHLFKYKNDKH